MNKRNTATKERLRALLDQWFKDSPLKSQWIKHGPVHVYMRKTPVFFQGVLYPRAITLSNITIPTIRQRQGWCREVMQWMEEQPEVDVLLAESVITPRMEKILERHEWTKIPNGTSLQLGHSWAKIRR